MLNLPARAVAAFAALLLSIGSIGVVATAPLPVPAVIAAPALA